MARLLEAMESLGFGARLVEQVTTGGPWKPVAWPLSYVWFLFLCFLTCLHVMGLCEKLPIPVTEPPTPPRCHQLFSLQLRTDVFLKPGAQTCLSPFKSCLGGAEILEMLEH